MGANCFLLFANLSLLFVELENHISIEHNFPYLSRYLDNLFVPIHCGSPNPLPILVDLYKSTSLRLVESAKAFNNMVFLDMQFLSPQSSTHLSFELYVKPGINYQYPHFNSFIPSHIKFGLVIGGAIQIFNHNSHLDQAKIAYDKFINILTSQCGYPMAWVIKIMCIYTNKISLPKLAKAVNCHIIYNFHPSI
eukprot:Phypoly_transcript_18145.p1 GENE.Phypoly_transcript_18145~~Phypoly_transcript_18145.p1  ORF type:complete len:225 (-),score=23.42 Phypoly_transcript_18145:102-680(-)